MYVAVNRVSRSRNPALLSRLSPLGLKSLQSRICCGTESSEGRVANSDPCGYSRGVRAL